MFYQEKPYFTGDKIKILRPKYAKFGKNNAQFFLSTMRKAFCSFAWGSSRFNVETLKKQMVSLPIKNNGYIDFDFMESFIAELEAERVAELSAYLTVSGLDNYELSSDEENALKNYQSLKWDTYNLEKLFGKSTRGKRLKGDDRIAGTLPFVTAGEASEGISAYISNEVEVFEKNTTTIDMFGSAKYRNYIYGGDDHTPVCLTSNGQDQDDYGAYVELTRVFDVVDFDYLERIFSKGGLIEYLKKTEKEKIETTASVATESLNRSQQRSNSNAIRAKIKEAVAASGKQYDGIKEIIDMVRQIIPYNRMLISSDGYLIPLDDRYFRIDAQNLGFKYGGEITCVGMITNIIGEDTDPNDSQNIFATLQFSVNEVLRQLLPTKERNLCVIHPIAVYYGN
jgi:putative type II site-specific deoxyribonuclease